MLWYDGSPMEEIDVKSGVRVKYLPQILKGSVDWFSQLQELSWLRIDSTPRSEYFVSRLGHPYTYGQGAGERTYLPQPTSDAVEILWNLAETYTESKFDVVFLNKYDDGKDQLGWHADNSPEMDDSRPITIMSLGATREIWFRDNENHNVTKLAMRDNDILIMPPGMQDTHMHRIPKSGAVGCGPRISLTFRGIDPNWKPQ